MEKTKREIYRSLAKNNATSRASIIGLVLVSFAAMLIVYLMHINHDRYVYGLSKDKSLLPLELIEKEDLEDVYEKGHISHFISLFYTVNQFNYKEQIEKSFWLIDDSGKRLYEDYTKRGHYNNLIQSSSDQYVKEINIVTNDENNFKAAILVAINKPNQKDARLYKIIVEGSFEKTAADYPKNPYGYMIYNFRETQYSEITE
ncbi:VirB8/TrbF family protein [Maribacter sp. 4G9]|uniref:VirB8/TrbF family protein n=1 Tax=Maribacter sp. 4G9 TaxID=1889777 RepID=UPI000C14CA68|nr:VirB8/TrbF family protein [Maribacter sp. 4G9]PIB39067.1 hypothetical protein BFP75_00905 [Maribacter sp. 4G9]